MTYGRLTGVCWLKLERAGNTVSGFISTDGTKWTKAGQVTVAMRQQLYAGLFGSSGLKNVTTRIVFDHVRAGASAQTSSSVTGFQGQ